jgi:Flp pilus assembly pilin Flp
MVMRKTFLRFIKDEDGASLIEYGLVLFLILIASLVTIGLVGSNTYSLFDSGDLKSALKGP